MGSHWYPNYNGYNTTASDIIGRNNTYEVQQESTNIYNLIINAPPVLYSYNYTTCEDNNDSSALYKDPASKRGSSLPGAVIDNETSRVLSEEDPSSTQRVFKIQALTPNAHASIRNLPLIVLLLQNDGNVVPTFLFLPATTTEYPLVSQAQPNKPQQSLNTAAALNGPTKSGEPDFKPETHTKDPVDIFSGSFVIQNVDLAVPGILQPQVSRLYHSAFADKDGPFGKGTGMVPYNSQLTVNKDNNGQVIKAAGTEIMYSSGDHTEVTLKDTAGNLVFTAPDKTGFADSQITVQADSQN